LRSWGYDEYGLDVSEKALEGDKDRRKGGEDARYFTMKKGVQKGSALGVGRFFKKKS